MNAPLTRPLVFHRPGDTELSRRLRGAVQGDVLFDRASRGRYSTDASIYQVEPIGVLIPRSHEDVRAAVDICRELGVPMLPRGGGSSQCGQTVGAALVIDASKHLREVVAFDRDAMTVTVEPGIALDALNAWLKPHGVWFPVDVSTSAQATLGGMAGNNSCGSRSIAYGNMVHNVLAADALLADGTEVRLGAEARMADAPPRLRGLLDGLRAIADRERDEIVRQVPKVMRRVGGYNLDAFHPQSERPYTADGSVNYAHLLVGSEGTLAWTRTLTLKLAPLPKHKTLGVVSFPTLYKAMELTKHIVPLRPAAVELVDRTMIELARSNPAFRPIIDGALVGEPDAILLVEFIGEDAEAPRRALDDLVALMGDLGLPGQVVRMTGANEQKALWEVRKAGLNIMMSMKGDGKPVSFIEDCAVPLEHLADYVDRLTQVFAKHGTRGTWYAHASVGTLHVRPILDMRRDGAAKMRAIAEEASAMVREYKGAYSGEHGDGLVRTEWVAWQFGPRLTRAFEEVKALFDPDGLMNPGKIVRGTKMDDARLFRYPPGYAPVKLDTALDWSAWDVHADPVTETVTAPGTGGDPAKGFAKAVEMCNNNGHCRKFDAGTMCPSFRVTRDEEHVDARPRQYAAARGVGPARRGLRQRGRARGAGSVRELQGLQARLPDRRRHGEDEDRVRLPLAEEARAVAEGQAGGDDAEVGAVGRALPVRRQPARRAARRGAPVGAHRRPVCKAHAAAVAQRHLPVEPRGAGRECRPPGRRAAGRYVQQLPRAGERARGVARAAGGGLSRRGRARECQRYGTRTAVVLRSHLSRRGARRRRETRGAAHGGGARAPCGGRCHRRRAGTVVPAGAP